MKLTFLLLLAAVTFSAPTGSAEEASIDYKPSPGFGFRSPCAIAEYDEQRRPVRFRKYPGCLFRPAGGEEGIETEFEMFKASARFAGPDGADSQLNAEKVAGSMIHPSLSCLTPESGTLSFLAIGNASKDVIMGAEVQ